MPSKPGSGSPAAGAASTTSAWPLTLGSWSPAAPTTTANAPQTADFDLARSQCRLRSSRRSGNARWQFVEGERERLDHRVRQQLRAHPLDRFLSRVSIARHQAHLNQLAGPDLLDPVEPERAQRVPNRQALRVVD